MIRKLKDVQAVSQRALTQEARYLSAFEWFERNGFAKDPLWVRERRKEAISRFEALGFPTARRGNEEWKYTDIGPIVRSPFDPLFTPAPPRLRARDEKQFTESKSGWARLVFVNGRYVDELSSISSLPPEASVMGLAEAVTNKADLAERHLACHADYQNNAFTALNTAFLHDGAFVHVPESVVVEEPIQLLFVYTSQQVAAVSHPRVLIVMGKDSKAAIVESYRCLSNGQYFTNRVTEVVIGEGSALEHYRIQQEGAQAFHVGTTEVIQARDSTYSSFTLDLGGKLTRNNLNVILDAEGSACTLNGLYMVTGTQHVDNQIVIDHAKPYTTSRELYKGVLGGKSRAVFNGSIIVRRGARKTDSRQDNKNLLLTDQCEADTKPAFWIYADDVRCGHGAASGQMDENALFYLKSRGMGEKAAQSLMIQGFANQVVNSVTNRPVRKYLGELMVVKLRRMLGGETIV